jgi:hypothetical protein
MKTIDSSTERWEFCETCQATKPLNHHHTPNGKGYELHRLGKELARTRKHLGLRVSKKARS